MGLAGPVFIAARNTGQEGSHMPLRRLRSCDHSREKAKSNPQTRPSPSEPQTQETLQTSRALIQRHRELRTRFRRNLQKLLEPFKKTKG